MMQNSPIDSSSFQFTDHKNHNKYLLCQLCTQLMLKPIRLHRCGHTLCSDCSESNKIKKCPLCLQKIHAKQQDILATRLIGQLEVKCKNNGCPWKGTYQNYLNMHKQKCRLKQGGIEAWLKGLQSMIEEKKLSATLDENMVENTEQRQQQIKRDEQIAKKIEQLHQQKQYSQQVNRLLKQNTQELQKEMKISGCP